MDNRLALNILICWATLDENGDIVNNSPELREAIDTLEQVLFPKEVDTFGEDVEVINRITDAQYKVINIICSNLNIECHAVDMASAREFITKNIDASKEVTARYRKHNFKPRTDGFADVDCDYHGQPMFEGVETFERGFM